jgi:Tfp pilus assembly protein PilN
MNVSWKTIGGVNMKDINFLVEENPFENEIQKEEKERVSTVKIIVTIIIVATCIFILFVPGIYVKSLEAKALAIEDSLTEARFKEVRTVKAQLSDVTNKVSRKKAILNGIDSKNLSASQALLTVKNTLPSGCYIKTINFNSNSISISGVAESTFVFSDLLSNIDRLKLFDGGSPGLSVQETQSEVEFSITYSR